MKADIFLVFCFLGLLQTVVGSSWHERKRDHKPKTLRTDRLVRVGKLSDGKAFEYFKSEILKPFLRVRVSGTEGNRFVQQHIKDQMSRLGWTLREDAFNDSTPLGKKSFTNIIAIHNPQATRYLTLACHFDSKYFRDFEFIGATDSAVPCAMLIDLVRHLNSSLWKSYDLNSELSLQLIFFDGEEAFVKWTATDSLYGARHLAAKMEQSSVEVEREFTVSQLETIDLFVLLDLIGTEETAFRNHFPSTSKFFERLQKIEMRLAKENQLEPVGLFKSRKSNKYFVQSISNFGGGVQDDHIPFLERGVPVVHLITEPFPHVWHKSSDNEGALHYPTISNIGKILRIFAVEYLHLNV